ncbi:MAG: helix-turn-helix transcriptional regulator [Humibacillus sp.]|nr:helix-turn-helix transcriptional regulator [Humibacillus sp.]MDN5778646.1 helix-turn-helix transcriptional regulator [Humibacillus sp.]
MRGPFSAARLSAAIEHIAFAGADDRALRSDVLAAIRRYVPFDAYAFLITDPATTVGCSPLAEVPNLATLPHLIRLKYLTPVNRWTGLPAIGCASLHQATGGRPEQSQLWREYLADLGVLDVASTVFTDRFGCWGFLDLWRHESCFTDDEVAALAGAQPSITSRLRHVQAAGFTSTGSVPEQRGPGALVLSPTLTVRAQTPQTQNWLAALVPPPTGQVSVPASAYNVAAQLLAIEAGVDSHPAQARVHLGVGTWLTLRADRLAGNQAAEDLDIVVTMEASSPAERRDVFSRCHALTRREDALLRHLADGVDTHTLARCMSISEHTVQDHLKAVFIKTSTSSRRELLAKSAGQ